MDEISAYYLVNASPEVASRIEERVRTVILRISNAPESARSVEQRPSGRVVPLGRYPFQLFYRVDADGITVLHIRHSSRRPWVSGY
ncbi:MAG: type II toxin-antitoxin system RelE/ParE family toxin [Rhizobiales bacterium]|nr:type II toxin-antitoxin system RelE/ParE family toxin [Hyphomicrobiales bacterium]